MSCTRSAQATFAKMLGARDHFASMALEIGLEENLLAAGLQNEPG